MHESGVIQKFALIDRPPLPSQLLYPASRCPTTSPHASLNGSPTYMSVPIEELGVVRGDVADAAREVGRVAGDGAAGGSGGDKGEERREREEREEGGGSRIHGS